MTPQQKRACAPLGLFHDWKDEEGRFRQQRSSLPVEDLAIRLFADLVQATGSRPGCPQRRHRGR